MHALCVETAGPLYGVALVDLPAGPAGAGDAGPLAEVTWRTSGRHGAELASRIEALVADHGLRMGDLDGFLVDLGPGSYAGLRAGVSTVLALASATGKPAAGVGRLELDATPFRQAGMRCLAVHDAGGGDWAWAVVGPGGMESGPRLGPAGSVGESVPEVDVVLGEVDAPLADALRARFPGARFAVARPWLRQAWWLAVGGWERLRAARAGDLAALQPWYLREPKITPSPKVRAGPIGPSEG